MLPGFTVALCIIWILLPQIHIISKSSYHDDVFLDTRLTADVCIAWNIMPDAFNWSSTDRQHMQTNSHQNKNTSKSCFGKTSENSIKNYAVPTGGTCVHASNAAMDEMDDPKPPSQGSYLHYGSVILRRSVDSGFACVYRFASGFGIIPLKLQVWLYLVFFGCDVVLALHTQERNAHQLRWRRQATLSSPARGAPGRVLLWGWVFFGLISACHFGHSDFSWVLKPFPRLRNPRYNKQRAGSFDPYASHFGVTTQAWFPEGNLRAYHLQVKGDGNCLWRSVARFTNMKWYKLKDRTIKHMKANIPQNSDEFNEIRKLSRRNAWGNYMALCGIASLLNRPIKVVTQQAIVCIDPPQGSSDEAIHLSLNKCHYSPMQKKSGKHIACSQLTSFPVNIHQYVQRADEAPTIIKHFGRFGDRDFRSFGTNIRSHSKNASKAKWIKKKFAAQTTSPSHPFHPSTMPPKYKPAGKQSGRRLEGESFAQQVQRLVKAKTKAVPDARGDENQVPVPKMIPKQPPYPPPPPRRRSMATSSDARAVDAIASMPGGSGIADHGAKAPVPYKAMPSMPKRPPTPPARPSRAPSIPTLSSIPEPKTPPKSKSAQAVCRLQEVVIVSRGSLCRARNSTIPEFRDGWEIVPCYLHDLSDPGRDRTLQRHIGSNPAILERSINHEPFVEALMTSLVQVSRSRKAILVCECNQGRHRSVAAATIAQHLLSRLIPTVRLQHLSQQNWFSTCGGNCQECRQGPNQEFQNSLDDLEEQLRARLARDYMACPAMHPCTTHVQKNKTSKVFHNLSVQAHTASRNLYFYSSGFFGLLWGLEHSTPKAEAKLWYNTTISLQPRNDVHRGQVASACSGTMVTNQSQCSTKSLPRKQAFIGHKYKHSKSDAFRMVCIQTTCEHRCDAHPRTIVADHEGGQLVIDATKSNAQTVSNMFTKPVFTSIGTKTSSKKFTIRAHLRRGDRQQPGASACSCARIHQPSSAAQDFFCKWLFRIVVSFSIFGDNKCCHNLTVLGGGMLNKNGLDWDGPAQHPSRKIPTSNISPLEECAQNILIGDCVNIENIRVLLNHPEAPFIQQGDGFQISLGAARLSLTKASNAFPNFTKVITAYMQQCNSKANGTTIVINKNMQTSLHIDSRNEKLPAYLTAVTDFGNGELFLKSDYGKESFEGHKGFLVPIPIGSTITVPTFKIPHATNYWKGHRIIMVLFTSPLKRIEACRNNLKAQLQQLGFHVPAVDKSWVDCEITGNSKGYPIYSKPTSIRGYFTTGQHRCDAVDARDAFDLGSSESEVWDVSSIHRFDPNPNLDQTRTWTEPFDSQISDIEHCDEEVRSPATTILDIDSESYSSDNNCEIKDEDTTRKRKRTSLKTSFNGEQDRDDEQRSSSVHQDIRIGDDRHSFRLYSGILGDRFGINSRDNSEIQYGINRSEQSFNDLFGFNNSRAGNWSIISDPIEPCTDDEMNCVMSGGGAPAAEFQPNKTDISKLVQKLKNVQHGYAPKQIRMLLISDAKFFKKIERTTDTKQLQSCVAAAAQRMGLSNAAHEARQIDTTNNPATSSRQKPDVQPFVKDKNPSGKGGLTATQKGKGRGDISQNEQKGRGKGQKGKHAEDVLAQTRVTENATSKGKAKGKGKQSKITYSIDPDGWNVRPLTEFSNTHGGIYMCEKQEQAKHIAEKGVGRNYPIGILAPFPMDIGVKQPEQICVEFVKHYGDQNQKISMQAFLHQVTYVDVEYRKMAPAINIQKPSIAKTSVCYLTFSDHGACAQTQIEIEQKKIATIKQWISSLVQHNRSLEILDVWNVQALQKQVNERIYQASVRVQSAQVESLLAMSGPGKLQVNVPGALRTNLQHIWLKKEGRPMTEYEVIDVMNENAGQHLGAFQVRGTWALRMLADRHNEMKMKLGRNEDPAYFLSNVPPEMEAENIQEILQQLKWNATVKDGERRWKRAGYTWMVRSSEDPKVWQFPITFGYERRTLKIEAARKPKTITSPPVPANSVMHFPTWNAQSRVGKLQPRIQTSQPTFVDVVNAARKRHRPEIAPIQREDSENWSDIEENVPKPDDNGLKQQLQDMMKQNSEQQQTIQQLMQQIQTLTAQVHALTAQNLTGGANNSSSVMPHPGNAS